MSLNSEVESINGSFIVAFSVQKIYSNLQKQ